MDFVATNWGRNTRFAPRPDHPLVLYFGDMDRNGSLDVVRAQSETNGGLSCHWTVSLAWRPESLG